MEKEEYRIFFIKELAQKIRDNMTKYSCLDLEKYTSEEKYEIIKKIVPLIKEFLSDRETNDKFIELIKKSEVNGDDAELKLATFEMIRNLNAHFVVFDKWDDVFFTLDSLTWNTRRSTIKEYFEKNCAKSFTYKIYTLTPIGWEERHIARVVIPKLEGNEVFYIKDMISEDDVIWSFCLIDSLLNYFEIWVMDPSGYSV